MDKKKRILLISFMVSLAILICCGGFTYISVNKWNQSLATQTMNLNDVKNKLSVAKAAVDVGNIKADKANGYDAKRVDADTKAITGLMKSIFEVKSKADYDKAVKGVMSKYGNGDSTFDVNLASNSLPFNGQDSASLDSGMTMVVKDVKAYVTNVSGTTYSYVAFVTVDTHGSADSSGVAVVSVSTSKSGQIESVNAEKQ